MRKRRRGHIAFSRSLTLLYMSSRIICFLPAPKLQMWLRQYLGKSNKCRWNGDFHMGISDLRSIEGCQRNVVLVNLALCII